jgi:flavorubredoxin
MKKYHIPEISNKVYAVGVKDRNLAIFDAIMPLHRGTTYNSYLVIGDSKTALIDSVGPGFENELMEKINQVSDLAKLDYIVMNHAEPDHGTAIRELVKHTQAKVVTSEKGAAMAARYYGVPQDRIQTVIDGVTIDLGGKTLKFVAAPWLHWPETMFTYLPENKLLFSCDFFGAHAPDGVYDDEIPEIISLAKDYFAEIMMPLRSFCKRGVETVSKLDLAMIAPSHGPVYKDTNRIIDQYRTWIAGDTQNKAIIAYATTWGATEKIAGGMIEALAEQGVIVKPYNLAQFDMNLLGEDLVDSRAIVLASPTILTGLHPLVLNIMNIVKSLKPPLKYGAFLNSYGWSKGASKHGLEFFESAKIESVGALEVYGPPSDEDYIAIEELAKQLAAKMKG